jgi:hypothetical protein
MAALLQKAALPLVMALVAGCTNLGPVESRSNCHTSDGQLVATPGCTVSYSASRTVTSTTTTTTTTTTDGTPAPTPSPRRDPR